MDSYIAPDGLRIESVRFRYARAGHTIVDNAMLHITSGESVAITGGNGSGKTTLLRLAAGLLRPQDGTITLDGEKVDAERQRIALVGADFDMFEYLTLEQNVQFFVRFYGQHLDQAVMDALFARYELAPVRRRVAQAASRGMRRKTQLIAALLQRPRLLIADEAMDGLDLTAQYAWTEDLREFTVTGGIALWTSHDEALINSAATRIIRLGSATVLGVDSGNADPSDRSSLRDARPHRR